MCVDKLLKIFRFAVKPRNFFIGSGLVLLFSLSANLAVGIISIPNNISLLPDKVNEIRFNLPFTAKITANDLTAAEASATNDTKLEKAEYVTTVSLNGEEPLTAVSEPGGKVDMSLAIFGLPIRNVSLDILPDTEVVPCGVTVGVRINTDGIIVLGNSAFDAESGSTVHPSDTKLQSGDIIVEANGLAVRDTAEFSDIVESSGGKAVEIVVLRNGERQKVAVTPVKAVKDGKYKIGAWLRDSTQGIGTITYYNPKTKTFGALGHGILDIDTRQLMPVKNGKIMESTINSVKRGKKGSPGELVGDINDKKVLGQIKSNTSLGLYGTMENLPQNLADEKIPIALKNEIHEGPAKIRSNINGNEIREYDVFIESVNRFNQDESKGMVVRITDQDLLTKTNGIVQGMSGSPIIQDGKLIGAVTHVFVQNPARGYGIFIENMIRQEKTM